MAYGVIMAGGSGTRFWPKSRRRTPKQLLQLAGGRTMLQLAADRLAGLIPPEQTLVVTSADLATQARSQLPTVPAANVVGEPVGRDTAACIGLAAVWIRRQDPGAVMVVVTADHLIRAGEEFRRNLQVGIEVAQEPGVLVTFGIKPTESATVYGYIHRGALRLEREGLRPGERVRVYDVKEFREKPPRELAQQYVASGQFYWNSGMFVWRAQTILDNLRNAAPDLCQALLALEPALGTPDQDAALARAYAGLRKISIDFAVMETASNVRVVEATFDWDDLGSWLALQRLHSPDADGNIVLARHLGLDTQRCVLCAEPGHLVATIGVRDLVVVQTPDATLVCAKDRVDEIKKLVQLLEQHGQDCHRYL